MKSMRSIQPPAFVGDVYRDLRDRRLLIPAVALLVALVAVPIVLAAPDPAPPPPPATADVEPTAAAPAVLAEGPGVRDYRERLEALKEKNPFDQKFTVPEPESADIGEPGAGADAGPGSSVPGGTTAPPATLPGDGTSPVGPTSPIDEPRSEPSKPKIKRTWFTWEVDVVVGPVGDTKTRTGLRAPELLPTRSNPVVALVGVGTHGNRVTFLLSNEVTATAGDGACAPSQASCDFLTLRPGQERKITVTPAGDPEVTYRLKLLGTSEKTIKRKSN